jgi:hypothetical protein
MDVKSWFDKRTLRHQDYADIARLLELKERQGLTISVCLPTLNSGAVLHNILSTLTYGLFHEHPLIDELAIIDGHSTDDTIEIAKRHGAKVFYDDVNIGDLPPASGKGEALWKSVSQLSGDIIAWLDSDIKNIHPRFVYGTVGPLLDDSTLGYVKGFYQRPITDNGVFQHHGGGRVTELAARPLINLFYPELAGLIQPLSGEYAGRREVLESVPFITGYGVETGLLIDILAKFGIDSIAQVDLETRVHGNQPLEALSRMSFAVMQTMFDRLDRDKKVKMLQKYGTVLEEIKHDGEVYSLSEGKYSVVERPPMEEMPSYRKAQAGRKPKWPLK